MNDAEPRLGAFWDGTGVDFRLFSSRAEKVELCLFDSPDAMTGHRCRLERTGDVWHTRAEGLEPGAFYGYRVHGPFAPRDGLLFNASKLLIDPYARAITGEPRPDPALFGFVRGQDPCLSFDGRDSVGVMPKCVVVDPSFDWQGVERPQVPWSETVLYETHVRGMTRLHPEIDPEQRGTFSALIQPPILDHLRRLGVTSIQLMPAHQSAPEDHLLAQGRRNYWGYSPIGFFAPNARYAVSQNGPQVAEFKTMVRELHRNGFEVILDVVYNHTAEGGLVGPTYSFKGIDNPSYYRLRKDLPSRWIDHTGCGNSLDVGAPAVHHLVLDSLRYWVVEMGVDGFRFDLATTLGREGRGFRPDSAFFRAVAADPLLAGVKWIAEPWDLGPGGYRLGQFPANWSEWNDRFRDLTRRLWTGSADGAIISELASRLAGSEDIFARKGSGPRASINYVISHDGFTLSDWVSYERKHNEANGEQNRDGSRNNLSRNWGEEGPSTDREILRSRDRARRNVLATLLLAQGVPMLHQGDEIGRSQGGNNNPYNPDNATSWTDWSRPDQEMMGIVAGLIALRKRFPQLRRSRYFDDDLRAEAEAETSGPKRREVIWLRVDGREMDEQAWQESDLSSLVMWLPPTTEKCPGTLLVALNNGGADVSLALPDLAVPGPEEPGPEEPGPWTVLFDSARQGNPLEERPVPMGRTTLVLESLSVLVLVSPSEMRLPKGSPKETRPGKHT